MLTACPLPRNNSRRASVSQPTVVREPWLFSRRLRRNDQVLAWPFCKHFSQVDSDRMRWLSGRVPGTISRIGKKLSKRA
jgi:hypothetical protein